MFVVRARKITIWLRLNLGEVSLRVELGLGFGFALD